MSFRRDSSRHPSYLHYEICTNGDSELATRGSLLGLVTEIQQCVTLQCKLSGVNSIPAAAIYTKTEYPASCETLSRLASMPLVAGGYAHPKIKARYAAKRVQCMRGNAPFRCRAINCPAG